MRRSFRAAIGLSILATASTVRSAEPAPAVLKSGVDASYLDPKVRPQDDLFRHINGKWLSEAPIPADRPLDGAFYKLRDKSEADLRVIIEESAASRDDSPGSESRKVGDLFASFMDEAKANELGLTPIQAELDRDRGHQGQDHPDPDHRQARPVGDRRPVRSLGRYRRQAVRPLYHLSLAGRPRPARRVVLPAREVQADPRSLRGPRPEDVRAGEGARSGRLGQGRILALETRLAKDHWDRVKSRDDTLTYNKKDRQGTRRADPGLRLVRLVRFDRSQGNHRGRRPPSRATSRRWPGRFDEVPLDHWKAYLARLEHVEEPCPAPEPAVRRGKLRLLRQDADRNPGASPAMEARRLGAWKGRSARRSASFTSPRSSRPPPRSG